MDNQRLFTWGLVGLLFFMTWQAWQLDYNQPPPTRPETETIAEPGTTPLESAGDLPELHTATAPATTPLPDAGPPETVYEAPEQQANLITVRTDVLEVEIDTAGGDIVSANVLKYPVAKDRPDEVVQLLSRIRGDYGVFRTGLRSGGDQPEPNHLATLTAERSSYSLAEGEDSLEVPLFWQRDDGLNVVKRYRFHPGSYRIELEYDIDNRSDAPWRASSYAQIVKTALEPKRSMFNVDTYSFAGPVLYDGDKYEKYAIDDLRDDGPVRLNAINGWIAAIQHHFLVAAVPTDEKSYRYDLALRDVRYTASMIGQPETIAANGKGKFGIILFVGPKLQAQLAEIAPNLKLTVDYGFLTILAQPLFWLLDKVHQIVKNWGWSIIIVTLLIKLVFYRLTAASGRSMAKMRNLQPRLKQIQDRYKDDRQKLSQAMMELYKREKVNPAAGCLPILVQMPFFLAFYWVLLESVEMRQAPFMLWINDLSVRDPFFVLPLLMGAAMFFQQKLNPAPPDPVQARVMSILPVVFTVFFAFFPAGLVLYWFTNTLLSIAQQWRINKVVEQEAKKR